MTLTSRPLLDHYELILWLAELLHLAKVYAECELDHTIYARRRPCVPAPSMATALPAI